MKKVTFCFITIVLILTLGGIGLTQGLPSLTESSPTPPTTPPASVTVPSSNLLPYSNPTHGFSFIYPSNWKQNTEVDGTGFLKTRFNLYEGGNMVAVFSVFTDQVESSLSQFAITQEKIIMNPQEMPGYKKINEEEISLGGLPAIKRLYTYNFIDSENNFQALVKGVDIYLVENNKGYVLAGEAVQDIFDRILPDTEIFFNSFKLSGEESEIITPVSVLPPVTITPEPPFSSNLFQYSEPTFSFSFNFPDNWKKYEEVEGTLKAELGFWEGDYLLSCFYVFVNDTDLSLSQYSMQEEEWMMNPQNMADYRKISEEAINIGSLPAIQRLYTYTFITNDNSKIPLKAIDVYIVNNNKSYMLVGEVDQDKFDRMFADLAIMFNSFAITVEPVSVSSASELPPITISDTGSTTSTSSTTSETAFKFCPYCGAPLQPDYQFCPGCGKPITIQRIIKAPKEEGVRSDKKTRINYPVNLTQTRGLSKELNQSDYSRGINRSFDRPFKSFKPAFISRGFGSKLARIFPQKPLLPWAVSRRIISDYYDYGKLLPNSVGRKISSQILTARSSYPENLNFSYLKGLGKQIAFNPNLGTTFRGGAINQLGSSLKNLGEGIVLKMVVSQAPLSEKTWVLRSSKRGAQEDISMGSFIGRISSKIGSKVIDRTRSSSSLWGCLSTLGQGIIYEIGAKREAETLPSLTPTPPQTTPIFPTIPPTTGPEGIVSPTPGAPAQGGITLTPPGQPVPAQTGTGGIVLPTPGGGVTQQPEIIWKQYSLNQAFGHNRLITGYLEYPSNWLVNLDSFNKSVTFSEDTSGLVSFTLFPGLMGQFNSAQDLAQQVVYLLQQQIPDLSIINQEFKIIPSPGGMSGSMELTNGKVYLRGTYQGSRLSFSIETMALYTGVFGAQSMGFAAITQSPEGVFVEKEQKCFNRMILTYKKSLGIGQQ